MLIYDIHTCYWGGRSGLKSASMAAGLGRMVAVSGIITPSQLLITTIRLEAVNMHEQFQTKH